MSIINSAINIVNWLILATDTTTDGKRVKERYMMNSNTWKVLYRPDCNIETAYCFLLAWEHTRNNAYLQLSRDIYDSIVKLQNLDGSFPFAHTGDTHIYTNDNSEVPIFLLRMAEIDVERAETYRTTALKGTDFLLSIQNNNGSWRVVDNDLHEVPMFTAHAVSALSTAYSFTNRKLDYKLAIEKALDWIITNILPDGRVKICYEVNNNTEYWRPPSSDQAIVIRGFAHAELYITDSDKKSIWKENRLKLMDWFDKLIDSTGAIKNGLGEKLNGADLQSLTDHVYTTAFGIEAYYYSFLIDKTQYYLENAIKIVDFSANNLYYSSKAETNGVIRGAYNVRDNNWDTSDLILNSGEEGGADMIYTGWVNSPLASWFFIFNKNGYLAKTNFLNIKNNNSIIQIPLKIPKNNDNGCLRVSLNKIIYYIPLVDINSDDASKIRVCVGLGKIKALKK